MSTLPDNPVVARLKQSLDPVKVVLGLLIAVAALFVWSIARSTVVAPLDAVVTEQLCQTYGEEIGRTATGFERSNRFGFFNRSVGYCSYGVGPTGGDPITVTIEETEPGSRYRAAKWIGIILQLGIVSIFLRFVVDPVMEIGQYLKARLYNRS